MRDEKKYIGLDMCEESAVIEALNEMRTRELTEGRSTDVASELILKIIRTPVMKSRFQRSGRIRNEAR